MTRVLAGLAAWLFCGSVIAGQLTVTASNTAGNALINLVLTPNISNTSALIDGSQNLNTDGSNFGHFDSLVWAPNAHTGTLDLIAADRSLGKILRYSGPGYGTATTVFAYSGRHSGPASPSGLSVDAHGNLYVVSNVAEDDRERFDGSGDDHAPSVWVLPYIGSSGQFGAPVLIAQTFAHMPGQRLVETLVAGQATALWNTGDLLVLVGGADPRVIVFSQPAIAGLLLNPGHALGAPTSTVLSRGHYPDDELQPTGMAIWPPDGSLLLSTADGRILRFSTATRPGHFLRSFANAGDVRLGKIKTGSYAGTAYAFVNERSEDGTHGRILQFGAPPANGPNHPLATLSGGVLDPAGLATTSAASAPASSCLASNGGCDLQSTLVTAAITVPPGVPIPPISGNVLEQTCIVQSDPRVTFPAGGAWSCNGADLDVSTLCPGFPRTLIPGSMCGHSGASGTGFVVLKTTANGIDPFLNDTYVQSSTNVDALLPGPYNLTCPQVPLAAWAPRPDLAGIEGTIVEGATNPYFLELTGLCDSTTIHSRGLSMYSFGLALNSAPSGLPNGLPGYVDTKFASLEATTAAASITPAVQMGLQSCFAQAQSYFDSGNGINGNPNGYSCAAYQVAACDNQLVSAVTSNPANFASNLTAAGGNPNPFGDLDGRLANLYLNINTQVLGNLPNTTWPPNNVPACVNLSATPATVPAGAASVLSWSAGGVPAGQSCTLQGPAGTALSSPVAVAPAGSAVSTGPLATAGSYLFQLDCPGNGGSSGLATDTVTVDPTGTVIAQTISFGTAPLLTLGGTGTLSATASSALAVTLTTQTPAFCTVVGNTVTGVGVGSCTVAANQAGNGSYAPAPQATLTLSVGPALLAQSITFGAAPGVSVGGSGQLTASASSGLTVVFGSSTPTVCSVSGSSVSGDSAGSCTVTANQPGDGLVYAAAPQATQTFAISPGLPSQAITFGAAPILTVGGTGTLVATASSGLPVTFSTQSPSTCTVSGSAVTGVAAGPCTVAADQAGDGVNFAPAPQVTLIFTIDAGATAQTITFGVLPGITVRGAGTLSASASSGLAIVFSSLTPATCSVAASTVTGIATGDCVIAADQSGNGTYAPAAEVTASLTVSAGSAPQQIALPAMAPIEVSGAVVVIPTSTSGLLPVLSSLTPSICGVTGTTVTGLSAGTCIVAADQPGNATYAPAPQVTGTVTVAAGATAQTIGWSPPYSAPVAGTATVSPVSSSGLPVTVISTTPSICTVIAASVPGAWTVTGVTAGACGLLATQPGNANFAPAPATAAPGFNILSGTTPQTITPAASPAATVGTRALLMAAASSGLTVTFSSATPAVCSISGDMVVGVATGTCSVLANQAGDATYAPAPPVTLSVSINAGRTPQHITFGAAPNPAVGATGTLVATSSAGLPVSLASTTPWICTVVGSTVTGVSQGNCVIAATQVGNATYAPAPQVTLGLTVGSALTPQSITFGPAPIVPVGGTGTVSAAASSGLAVALSSATPAVCTVAGTMVTGVAQGICSINANQAGNANYAAAPQATLNLSVSLQTITFGAAPVLIVGGAGTVTATASSGLPVVFTSLTPSICTVAGATATGNAVGNCVVAANQPGNGTYFAAQQVTQNLSVTLDPQTITFGAAPLINGIGAVGSLAATATSGLAVTFSSLTPALCTVSGSAVTGVALGTCTVAANQAGDGKTWAPAPQVTQPVIIGQASQSITFGAAPTLTIGTGGPLSATATSGLAVSFASTTPTICTVSASTVTGVSQGSCVVSANQAGNASFLAAPQVTQSITVNLDSQTISFGAAPGIAVGTSAALSATASSGLGVVFTSTTPALCTVIGATVTGVSNGTCVVAANQPGNSVYAAAPQVTQNIVVGQQSQTISFTSLPTITIGTSGTISATASSGLAVTLTTPTAAICSLSGTTVTGIAAGTCVVNANQPGNTSYLAAPQASANVTVTLDPQTITFGAAPSVGVGTSGTLSATASSGLAVAFTSTTPTICTVTGSTLSGVSIGSCLVAANQAGNAQYAAAPQVTLTVPIGLQAQTISFGAAPSVSIGTSGTVSASASSGLAVTLTSTTPSICTLSGTTVTGVAAGACIIAANQAGNSTYAAAPQATQTITVSGASADVGVTMTVSNAAPAAGSNIVFTLTASNAGPAAANGVSVADALPSGFQYVGAVASAGSFNGITWTIGTFANGASATLAITVAVLGTGTYTNVATISDTSPTDPNSANNTVSITVTPTQSADLALTESANTLTPVIGGQVTLTTIVTNNGPSPASGITVAAPLSSGFSLASSTASSGSYNAVSGVWSVTSIAIGASVQLGLVANVLPTGVYSATAGITASTPTDPNAANNSATLAVSPQPGGTLTVTPNPLTLNTFDSTTMTATLSRSAGTGGVVVGLSSSNAAALAVPATATIPAGQTSVNFTATAGSAAGTATVTAAGTALTSGSALATVSLRPLAITLLQSTLGVGLGTTGTITLTEAAPAGGAAVAIAVDNAAAATLSTSSVVIPAGSTTGSFTVTGLAAGAVNVSAAAPGYLGSSTSVAVYANLVRFSQVSNTTDVNNQAIFLVGNGLQAVNYVCTSTPAPVGGLQVQLTSNNANVLLSTDTTGTTAGAASVIVTLGQGQTGCGIAQSEFIVQGLASGGTANVTATVVTSPNPGFAAASPLVVTLGPGGYFINSSGTLSTTTLSAPTLMDIVSCALRTDGTCVIYQTVAGGRPQSVPVTVAPAALGSFAAYNYSTGAVGSPITAVPVAAGSYIGYFYFVPGNASGGGSGTIAITQPAGDTVPLAGGLAYLQAVALTVTAAPTGFNSVANATDVNGSAIYLVGNGLEAVNYFMLGAAAPSGGLQVQLASNNANVLLSTDSTGTTAGTSTITLTIAAGGTLSPVFYIQGLAASGTANITATILTSPNPGFAAASPLVVTLGPGGYFINSGAALATTTQSAPTLMDIVSCALRSDATCVVYEGVAGGRPQPVPVAVTPASLGSFAAYNYSTGAVGSPITAVPVAAGSYIGYFYFVPGNTSGGGSGTIAITQPAGDTVPLAGGLAYLQAVALTVTAAPTGFSSVSNATDVNGGAIYLVGNGLEAVNYFTLGAAAPSGGLQVQLASNNANVLLSTDTTGTTAGTSTITLTIAAGSTQSPGFFIQGLAASGTANITATILTSPNPGFAAASPLVVTLGPGGYFINSGASLSTTTQSAPTFMDIVSCALRTDGTCVVYEGVAGGLTQPVPVTVTPASLGSFAAYNYSTGAMGSPITAVPVPAGSYLGYFYFVPNSSGTGGTGTITITQPSGDTVPMSGGLPYNQTVAITENLGSANFSIATNYGGEFLVGQGLQAGNYIALAGTAPAGGLQVTVSSDNPNVLLSADTTGTTAGAATISLTIGAGGTQSPLFFIQGLAGTGSAQLSIAIQTVTTEFTPGSNLTVVLGPSGYELYCASAGCSADALTGGYALTTTTTAGPQLMYLYVYALDPATSAVAVGETVAGGRSIALPLTLSNTAIGEFLDYPAATTIIGSVTLAAGSEYQYFEFAPLAAGTGTMGFTAPSGAQVVLSGGYPVDQTITVTVN